MSQPKVEADRSDTGETGNSLEGRGVEGRLDQSYSDVGSARQRKGIEVGR